MPFAANRDAEYHWRTRYRLPQDTEQRPQGPDSPATPDFAFRKPPRGRGNFMRRMFSWSRRRRMAWLAFSLALMGGVFGLLVVYDEQRSGSGAPPRDAAAPADGAVRGVEAAPADFETLLANFSASREASLVGLRGYILTEGEGFRTEWREAAAKLKSDADAIERHSVSWTDGLRLVQLAEMKRLVERLLAEQRAIAGMIGTVNRYPGLQLFNEDVRPGLDEAQRICAEVLDVMLANSSPEDAGAIDPFAKLRGDLDDLRLSLVKFTTGSSEAGPPAAASRAGLSAMLTAIDDARKAAPASVQPKIDRLVFLIRTARENLERVFALRAGQRWDYADYAFKTRIVPLAGELQAIAASWEGEN